jgi:NTE family protein
MATLRKWLEAGDFSLSLSSSFFGFFAHCGITRALLEEGFRPKKLSGSSAGALIGGALASGVSPEAMAEILFRLKREDFWDPGIGLGYLRGRKMLSLLERHLASTFADTELPIEVAVFDLIRRRTCFLREGSLPKAVAASCAVPLLFHPVKIGRSLYTDGGLFHKSGVPPVAPRERNLCIYLHGDNWRMPFRQKSLSEGLSGGQRVWGFRGLPSVSYHCLERGPEAYEQAYRRAKATIDLPFENRIAGDAR